MTTHALYRFYDAAGDLLYVGITLNPDERWKKHRKKPWWHTVASIRLETYLDRESVLAAEREAIITEHPVHNVVHNSNNGTTTPRRVTSPTWGVDAADMPDDCHDNCVKRGIYAIYYPFKWRDGVGYYRCANGHLWTCGWGHNLSGQATRGGAA